MASARIPGFFNKHGQVLLSELRSSPDSAVLKFCQLGCSVCGHVYRIKTLDIFDTQCPRCQVDASPAAD